MTGERVPIVLVPRFTGLVGDQDFATVPIDVTPYTGGNITIWRGPLIGTSSPTFTLFFEVSSDAQTWIKVPLSSEGQAGYSPTAGDAGALTVGVPLLRKWFRARIELRGGDPAVSCWCAGNVDFRVD